MPGALQDTLVQGSEHRRTPLSTALSIRGCLEHCKTPWYRALSMAGWRQPGQLTPGHTFPALRDTAHPSPQDRGGPAQQTQGWNYFLLSVSHLLLLLLQKPRRMSHPAHYPMHRPGKPGEAAGPDAWAGSSLVAREESWLSRLVDKALRTGEFPHGHQPKLLSHIFPLHPPIADGVLQG